MKKAVFSLLLSVLLFAFSGTGFTVSAEKNYGKNCDEITLIADGIEALKMRECGAATTQEWLDTGLAESAGQGGEWYILALYDKGFDMSAFRASLEAYIADNTIPSATTNLKLALFSVAAGGSEYSEKYAEKCADEYIGEQGIMSLVFGLHLLNNDVKSTVHTREEVITALLDMQLPDGGWAIFGEYGDVDVTAMTVQALSPYYDNDGRVGDAVDRAVSLLSEKQLDDGDYSSFGKPNLESTAQVLAALSSLNIDFSSDERFIKNGNTLLDGMKKYRLESGGFSHEADGAYNATATVQAYYCLHSYLKMQDGKRLFVFEMNELEKNEPTDTASVKPSDTRPDIEISQNIVVTTAVTTEPASVISAAPEKQEASAAEQKRDYKPVVLIVIACAASVTCAVLFIAGKRSGKNFLLVVLAAGAAAVFVIFTNFSSADEYYKQTADKDNVVGTVTFSISCASIVGEDSEYIPADGFIIPAEKLEISSGETVRDILVEAVKAHGVQLDISADSYVRGIGYIYEFDYGDLSGWMYHVNGEAPSVNCGGCTLSDGDVIEWLYTRNIGLDLN